MPVGPHATDPDRTAGAPLLAPANAGGPPSYPLFPPVPDKGAGTGVRYNS